VATSGTIGTTVFKTRKVVDQAYRRCRLPAQSITGEMLETALTELSIMLPAWLNSQLPLWCQTKYIVGLTEGVYSVALPVGVIDVLDVNLRTTTRPTDGTATATTGIAANAFDADITTTCVLTGVIGQNIALTLNAAASVQTTGLLPASSGTYSLDFQYLAADGVTWTSYYSNTAVVLTDSQWYWFDSQGIPQTALGYRMVLNSAVALSVRELVFANAGNEINMARINRDDWFYLPDKYARGRPVQFWLDRQRSNCVMNVWPAPASQFVYAQLTMLAARQIMDVGTLNQEIEVPNLWWDALVCGLAARLAIVTPEVKPEMIPLTKSMASEALSLAFAENRDRSPINIVVDISPYTS
jgi:hypothetical protein